MVVCYQVSLRSSTCTCCAAHSCSSVIWWPAATSCDTSFTLSHWQHSNLVVNESATRTMSFDDKIVHEKLKAESPDDLERKASLQEGETLAVLGYKEELTRNRSLWTLLFQSLAIAAVPYGEGSPLISAIYGGGQLSMFLGWIVVLLLDECIALSLGELASRYPTSGGPSYWSFRMYSTY